LRADPSPLCFAQGQHVIRVETEKIAWNKERKFLKREAAEKAEEARGLQALLEQTDAECAKLKARVRKAEKAGASGSKQEAEGEGEVAGLRRELEVCQQAKLQAVMSSAVNKEHLKQLRAKVSTLQIDKEEAVAQAAAVRGVLGKELDAMEEQLEETLQAQRDQSQERGEPALVARLQRLESSSQALRDQAEVANATIRSLDDALHLERVAKEGLASELQRLHDGGAVQALEYLEGQDWGTASALALSRGMSPRGPRASPWRKAAASPIHRPALQAAPLMMGLGGEEEGCARAKRLTRELAELRAELEEGTAGDLALGEALHRVVPRRRH